MLLPSEFFLINTPKYLTYLGSCKILLNIFNFIFLDSLRCLGLVIIKIYLLVFEDNLFAILSNLTTYWQWRGGYVFFGVAKSILAPYRGYIKARVSRRGINFSNLSSKFHE